MNNDKDLLDFTKPLELPDGVVGQRPTESYNPYDCYICPHGHLQYNLTEEAKVEIKSRNVDLPPICHEGMPCVLCSEPIRPLETDVKELQFRVSNFMKMASRLKQQQPGLLQINSDMNDLAYFIRWAYAYEIEQGEPQHSGSASKAAIYYLKKERRRGVVVVSKMWRAVLHLIGVR